jgi:hypothetical protein
MAGARMQMIVVRKLTPLKMVPNPDRTGRMIHTSPAIPGEFTELARRRVRIPADPCAPAAVRKLASRISPPKVRSH